MGKRASVSSSVRAAAAAQAGADASPPGKSASPPAKKQRGGEALAKADPILEACRPILKALKAEVQTSDDEDRSGAEMLCAVLPFALKLAEGAEKRHEYQERMLDSVAARLASVVAARKGAVEALEKELAELQADEAASASKHEEIVARIGAMAKERDDAESIEQTRQEGVAAAQKAFKAAEEKAAGTDKEVQAITDDRASFEAGLTEMWAPLKASELRGAQWRKRDQLLARLLAKLESVGVEMSLRAGLQTALKILVEQRSEFAKKTIEFGEGAYSAHMNSLQETIDGFDKERAARTAVVAEATLGIQAASEANDAAVETHIQAQNAWAQETGLELEFKAKVDAFAPTMGKLEAKLSKAQAKLADLQGVSASFVALRPIGAGLQKDAAAAAQPAGDDVIL